MAPPVVAPPVVAPPTAPVAPPADDPPCRVVDASEACCGAVAAGERCPARSCVRLTCDQHWPASFVALAPDRAAVALYDRNRGRATATVTLGTGGAERFDALPVGLSIPRLVVAAGGAVDVVADAPAAERAAYVVSGSTERALLPAVGRITLDGLRAADGRVDVLIAHGSSFPVPLHVASRALDGTWSSRPVGVSPWPYAALTHDVAGQPLVAFCALGARPTTVDLVTVNGAGARRAVLRGASCGDQPIAMVPSGDAPVLGYRVGDIHVAVAGRDGRYADVRVPGTAAPNPTGCTPAPPLDGLHPVGRCTARGTGGSRLALARTERGVWLVYLATRLEIDYGVERHCHPVDPAGRRAPPPSCDDVATPLEDRSDASLVVARVDATGARPTVAERLRVPLGRMPSVRNLLLVATAGEVLHAIVATDAGGVSALRYITVDLPLN